MGEKNTGFSFRKPSAPALFLGVSVILAYALGCRSEPVSTPASEAPEVAQTPGVAVAGSSPTPAATPLSADFLFPVLTPAPAAAERDAPVVLTEEPAPAFTEEEPREDPETCLTLEASPNRVDVYGSSGLAVQLTVRARNRCSQAFSGRRVFFRAYATAPGGFDLASATGRFTGTIPAWGSSDTLIALDCDPTRVERYRVELVR